MSSRCNQIHHSCILTSFPRCVDKFFVWVWPDGTLKTGSAARKIEVDKNKISAIINVEPCIGYRWDQNVSGHCLISSKTYRVYSEVLDHIVGLLWNLRKTI